MQKIIDFIRENWTTGLAISPFLYEFIARLWPTKWNISILDNAWKILNFLVPNVRKPDGKEIISGAQTSLELPNVSTVNAKKKGLLKNLVKVALNRFVLKTVLLCMLSISAFSQNNVDMKALVSRNADSTTVKNYVNSLQSSSTTTGPIGAMYYNKQSNKWRFYYDSTWHDNFGTSGGGGTVTSVSGTLNRITSTGGTTPVIDISSSYVGQSSITTLGTIATGVWNATTIPTSKGGTGLTSIGSPLQVLRVNSIGNGLEYATPQTIAFGSQFDIPTVNSGSNGFDYTTITAERSLTNTTIRAKNSGDGLNITNGFNGIGLSAGGTAEISLVDQNGFQTLLFSDVIGNAVLSLNNPVPTGNTYIKTSNAIAATTPSSNIRIETGQATGPGSAVSGSIMIQPGLSFGVKPGNVIISGGINAQSDDSGDVILSSAKYTGDSTTISVLSSGTVEVRTHSQMIIRPNSLTTVTDLSLVDCKLASNMISGTAVLVGGTATVTYDYINGDIVLLTVQTPGGTQGFLSIANAGGGTFDIVSTSATETSTVGWFVVTHF